MNLEFSDLIKKNDHKYLTVEDAIIHLFGEAGLKEIRNNVDFSKSIKRPTSLRSILKSNIMVAGKLKKDPLVFYKTILEDINSGDIERLKAPIKKNPLKWQLDIVSYFLWSRSIFNGYLAPGLKSLSRTDLKLLLEEMEEVINATPLLSSKLREQQVKLKEKRSRVKPQKEQTRKGRGKTPSRAKTLVFHIMFKVNKKVLGFSANKLAYHREILKELAPNQRIESLKKGDKKYYAKICGVSPTTVSDWIREFRKKNSN